jgi:transcriptional regulator with XRE-family HTH domain
MEFSPPFHRWLKQRRVQIDFTQVELAQRISYSVATVRKVESGDLRPSRQLAAQLAVALDVPPGSREAFVAFATGQAPSPAHTPNNLPA